jgi:hypothetical protein
VLEHLSRLGPQTDLQLQERLKMPANTERPRRGELVDMGLVMPTDQVRVHHDAEWRVWSLTRAGEGVARQLDLGVDTVYLAESGDPVLSTSDSEWGDGTLF